MPKTGIAGMTALVISHRVDAYRRLLEKVDGNLAEELALLGQQVEKVAGQAENDDTLRDYQDYLVEEYQEGEELKSIFLNSFFAGSFALFEHELVRICEQARSYAKTLFSVKETGGRNYMDSAKDYLKKHGVDFPAATQEWSNTKNYQQIRNKIMHQGGVLEENDGISSYANDKGILITTCLGKDKDGKDKKLLEVKLTKAFCERALRDMGRVLQDANDAYWQWRQGKPNVP